MCAEGRTVFILFYIFMIPTQMCWSFKYYRRKFPSLFTIFITFVFVTRAKIGASQVDIGHELFEAVYTKNGNFIKCFQLFSF